MLVFKSEFRQALREPGQLPGDELSESVEYDNGSDEAFLCWLWHELYADEPSGAEVSTRLSALPEPFAGRLHWLVNLNLRAAARVGEWSGALDVLLAGLITTNAAVSPAERDELAAPAQGDRPTDRSGGQVQCQRAGRRHPRTAVNVRVSTWPRIDCI